MKDRIKELRKTLGLTQQSFGQKLGVSCVSVSLWERGESKIVRRTIKQLENIFNVNPVWLETGEGDMFKSSGDGAGRNDTASGSEQGDILNILTALTPDNRDRVKKYAAGLLDIQQQEKEIE